MAHDGGFGGGFGEGYGGFSGGFGRRNRRDESRSSNWPGSIYGGHIPNPHIDLFDPSEDAYGSETSWGSNCADYDGGHFDEDYYDQRNSNRRRLTAENLARVPMAEYEMNWHRWVGRPGPCFEYNDGIYEDGEPEDEPMGMSWRNARAPGWPEYDYEEDDGYGGYDEGYGYEDYDYRYVDDIYRRFDGGRGYGGF